MWRTKEGDVLLVYEMETRHLHNTIPFLARQGLGGGVGEWIEFAAEELRYRTENPEYEALCHAIHRNREDYLPRLALADWLQEHGLETHATEVRQEVEWKQSIVSTQWDVTGVEELL